MSLLRSLTLVLTLLWLSGCATYSQDINQGLSLAQKGEWSAAETALSDALKNPQDELLALLELGALAQYQGDYQRSNALLEQAEALSDRFFQESFADRSWALLSNPRQGRYQGNAIERVYISYFKSLNYLALAQQSDTRSQQQQWLDAALIESRRIDLKLNEIAALTPSYADIDSTNQAFYEKALDFLAGFYTGALNAEDYAYREDAWARYLEGLQYEASAEYDNARIAYQKSAQLYESGYATQYRLSDVTAARAWFDTARMMQKAGGWQEDYPRILKEKVPDTLRQQWQSYQDHDAELVVIEHQGFIPAKHEMTLLLYADPNSYSLVLEPLHGAGSTETNDAFHWFTMVYADINPLSMLANYHAGDGWTVVDGLFTKRVILGRGLWAQLDTLNIDTMLQQQPIRVTIPYYNRFQLDNQTPQLNLAVSTDNDLTALETPAVETVFAGLRMASLADIAMQDQLSRAQQDIYEGLIREMLRTWLVYQLESAIEDKTLSLLAGLAGKVAVFSSSAAETRHWLTLPAQVKLTRQPIQSGLLTARYRTPNGTHELNEANINANSVKVWTIRTLN